MTEGYTKHSELKKYLFLRQLRTHQAFKRATRKATLKYAAKGIIILAYIILYHMPAYLW